MRRPLTTRSLESFPSYVDSADRWGRYWRGLTGGGTGDSAATFLRLDGIERYPSTRRDMQKASRRRTARGGVWRLVAAAIASILAALGLAAVADAQRPERPKHLIGGQLVEEPDMNALPPGSKVMPDGSVRVPPDALIGVVGADGKPLKNPDGSPKKVRAGGEVGVGR